MEFRPGRAGLLLSLLLLAALSRRSLEKSLPAGGYHREQEESREESSPGLIRCGEYSNQVLPNGRCRIVATLPQGDEQRCPDLFRCTDEVSYWLHENEERKQQILELRELIAELQEELRNHRHRVKALEIQAEVSSWLHENEERKQQILELRELIAELQEELRNHRHRVKALEIQPEVSSWLHENEERKQQILELRELIAELQEELRNHRHRVKALEIQAEVSSWLQENEERKQQILELRELIAELQEELRNHRHRVKALQIQQEEAAGRNQSLLQRVQDLEQHSRESSTLQHIQATLLYDIQAQINNISALADWAWRNPSCLHPADVRLQEEMQHPEIKHGRNCPIDCASVYHNGLRRSGIYSVLPSVRGLPIEVLCEMETEGGGWTVIQRRQDGSVDFNRTWNEYKEGFGDLNGEFWLGNDNIHRMTSQGDYSLRIDLEDWNNKHKHAFYQVFSIEDEENFYRLHVDGFSGMVEDSFAWYHDKRSFSTPDSGNVCAEISHGGWWYHQCFFSNLNGVYYKGGRYSIKNRRMLGPDGIVWYSWKDTDYYSLRKVVMMIRPRAFRPHFSP